jgi:hypothetical protein
MIKADCVHSTPRTNTPIADHPNPPRPLTSQERSDQLVMRWRLARAAGIPADKSLDPKDILADFLEAELLIPNPEAMAQLIMEKLHHAGFEVVVTTEDQS